MLFRTVKDQVVKILGDSSNGTFRVIGYQGQSKATDELTFHDRSVQIYYSDGDFPKTSGRQRGPKSHNMTFQIDMSASAAAQGDLSVLESSTATAKQKAEAISSMREAAEIADKLIDVLIDAVYQILMDARNEGLGLDKGQISMPWVDRIQKDTIVECGDLVLKTANMKYSCRAQESVPGAVGNDRRYRGRWRFDRK
jgi:hypothetical protein